MKGIEPRATCARTVLATLVASSAFLAPRVASADVTGEPWYDQPGRTSGAGIRRDEAPNAPGSESAPDPAAAQAVPLERPFLHLVDPTLPEPLGVVAGYGAAYSATSGASRPLAANLHRSGFVNLLTAELGMHPHLSAFATGFAAAPDGGRDAQVAFQAGLRALLTTSASRTLRLTLTAGGLREFEGSGGAFGEVTTTADIGRLRLAAMAHTEKVFAADRDEVDLYVVAGPSYRLAPFARIGAEYVGQDLEDAWEDEEAEGGVRHFAGPTIAFEFDSRFFVTAGPALGLSSGSPPLLGRVMLAYAF